MKFLNNPVFKLVWYSFIVVLAGLFIRSAKVEPLQPDKVVDVAVKSFLKIAQENIFPEFQIIQKDLKKDRQRKDFDKKEFIEKQSGKIFDQENNGINDVKWGDIKTARRYIGELEEDGRSDIIKNIEPYVKDIYSFFEKNKHLNN